MHNFATAIHNNKYVQISWKKQRQSNNIDQVTCHSSFVELICSDARQAPSGLLKAEKQKTFLLPHVHTIFVIKEPATELVISTFNKLCMLTCRNMINFNIPSICIGELRYTNYLDISDGTCIQSLPYSLIKLYNLETLILNGCIGLRKSPKNTWKLTKFQHLEFMGCSLSTCIPLGLGKLTTLHTIIPFHSVGASQLKYLYNLT
jgi:hypothetical protein